METTMINPNWFNKSHFTLAEILSTYSGNVTVMVSIDGVNPVWVSGDDKRPVMVVDISKGVCHPSVNNARLYRMRYKYEAHLSRFVSEQYGVRIVVLPPKPTAQPEVNQIYDQSVKIVGGYTDAANDPIGETEHGVEVQPKPWWKRLWERFLNN